MQILQESTCVRVFFKKVAGPRTVTLLKRDSNIGYLLLTLRNLSEHLVLQNISSDWFWKFKVSSRKLLKKRLANMFFCEFCKIFENIGFFWQNTSGWLLLLFICRFWEFFQNTYFIEHLSEIAISWTCCRISTTRYNKKLFHTCFSSIL